MTIKNKMLLGALLLVTSAAWAAPATAGSTNTSGISKYELSSFIADFKHFKPGASQRCTAPMSTTLSSGSYVTCPRLMPDALDLYGWRVRVDQRHRR